MVHSRGKKCTIRYIDMVDDSRLINADTYFIGIKLIYKPYSNSTVTV